MKVIILGIGSREFNNYDLVQETLDSLIKESFSSIPKNEITFISGRARGADTLVEKYANMNGYDFVGFPAKWKNQFGIYDSQAGYKRNVEMVKYMTEFLDIEKRVVAFWDGESRGTKHCIGVAKDAYIPVQIINIK